MKNLIPKLKIDTKQLTNAFSELRKIISKNKKVQAGIFSIPVIGWASSEIHRGIDKKKYQKQIALYQEVLRKHQAEIDILKSDKEREEYKQMLWKTVLERKVED